MENLKNIQAELKKDENRSELISHPVLKYLKDEKLTHEEVAIVIGQWYYPLANFTFFLASCVAHIKIPAVQTFLCDILNEELGCGDPDQSHLKLFESTMVNAGFSKNEAIDAGAFKASIALVDGYKKAAKTQNTALGFVYATEVADLAMVSAIGYSVANLTGKTLRELPWADIHIQQEPNHVNNVDNSLDVPLGEADSAEILRSARLAWKLWVEFFSEIGTHLSIPAGKQYRFAGANA